MNIFSQIFSIKNFNHKKIVRIFGIKFTFSNKLYIQNERILKYLAFFKAKYLFEQHYNIKIPAECCEQGSFYELINIRLGDIRREWEGKIYKIEDCSQYKYLETRDNKIYDNYIQKHIDIGICSKDTAWNIDRYLKLEKSIETEGYNPQKCIIAVNKDNIIIDGVHRSSLLLKKYGAEYIVQAIRVK